jgi:AraC-like DNA-binding protein
MAGLMSLACDGGAASMMIKDPGLKDAEAAGVLVLLPWDGAVACGHGRDQATITGSQAVVIQAGRPAILRWDATGAVLVVMVPARLVRDTMWRMTGRRILPRFAFVQPDLTAWVDLIIALCRDLDGDGRLAGHPVAAAHRLAVGALLTTARHDAAASIYATGPGLSPTLRPAVAWVYDHLMNGPIEICDIEQATGVPRRTLHRAWVRELGMTPQEWIRQARLAAVAEALLDADPLRDTVTDIAIAHGYGDLEWFATTYKEVVGERPSDTLRSLADPAPLPPAS